MHKNILCCTRYSIVQKLSNKQSAEMICRIDRLRTAHRKRQKGVWALQKLFAAHAFNYIMLRVNPGLICGIDLATAVDNNLDNN